jgi:hypothetical protein
MHRKGERPFAPTEIMCRVLFLNWYKVGNAHSTKIFPFPYLNQEINFVQLHIYNLQASNRDNNISRSKIRKSC